MTSQEIGTAGEQIVGSWLKQNGYSVIVNTNLPGSTDIEANGTKVNLLVQVKTAEHPNEPQMPSSDEIRNIKSRASNTSRQAWIAQVKIDSTGQLMGNIIWTNLSKD